MNDEKLRALVDDIRKSTEQNLQDAMESLDLSYSLDDSKKLLKNAKRHDDSPFEVADKVVSQEGSFVIGDFFSDAPSPFEHAMDLGEKHSLSITASVETP